MSIRDLRRFYAVTPIRSNAQITSRPWILHPVGLWSISRYIHMMLPFVEKPCLPVKICMNGSRSRGVGYCILYKKRTWCLRRLRRKRVGEIIFPRTSNHRRHPHICGNTSSRCLTSIVSHAWLIVGPCPSLACITSYEKQEKWLQS